jgi:glycosyltransferase involved in cell wall biosynthesis
MYTKKDITGIVLNWRTARMSRGAVINLQKYYPDLKEIIIGDDGSADEAGDYNGDAYAKADKLDMDNSKLRDIPGTRFIEFPDHQGHGLTIDRIVSYVKTPLMLTMDSDLRLIEPGLIEKYLEEFNKDPDNTYGIGPTLANDMYGRDGQLHFEFIDPFFSIWNMAILKKYPRVSFTNFVGPMGNHWGTAALLNWQLQNFDTTHVNKPYKPIFWGALERISNLYHLRKFHDDVAGSERFDKWNSLMDG